MRDHVELNCLIHRGSNSVKGIRLSNPDPVAVLLLPVASVYSPGSSAMISSTLIYVIADFYGFVLHEVTNSQIFVYTIDMGNISLISKINVLLIRFSLDHQRYRNIPYYVFKPETCFLYQCNLKDMVSRRFWRYNLN